MISKFQESKISHQLMTSALASWSLSFSTTLPAAILNIFSISADEPVNTQTSQFTDRPTPLITRDVFMPFFSTFHVHSHTRVLIITNNYLTSEFLPLRIPLSDFHPL